MVGIANAHGRVDVSKLLTDLEVIPQRSDEDTVAAGMDLDAVLARKPGIVLVDELARTNPPGS